MPKGWAKGFTKETHPSILKISKTFKQKKLDNFAAWRKRAKVAGVIKSIYPQFKQDGDLAELIGVVLGDGNIGVFSRSERLVIAGNTSNEGFIRRYSNIIEIVFKKKPVLVRSRGANCTRISIYEKHISKRLGIPSGNKGKAIFIIPSWIKRRKQLLIRYLRGLYEAEGSFCVHKPTSTYKFLFKNTNPTLLKIVYEGMKTLGFHPHQSFQQVQISKKAEVYAAQNLLQFRQY